VRALTSESFQKGYIRLVFTPLANPDVLAKRQRPDFASFTDQFTSMGFDVSDIDDGWAVNAHDALTTVVAAVNSIPLLGDDGAARKVTPRKVNTAIGAFSRPDNPALRARPDPVSDCLHRVTASRRGLVAPLSAEELSRTAGPGPARPCGRRPPGGRSVESLLAKGRFSALWERSQMRFGE